VTEIQKSFSELEQKDVKKVGYNYLDCFLHYILHLIF